MSEHTDQPAVRCESCHHFARGRYCAVKCQATEPDDACSSWQSRASTTADRDRSHRLRIAFAELKRPVDTEHPL